MVSDERWDESARERRQARTISELMRDQLRSVGIELDAPAAPESPAAAVPITPDREAIREILIERDAPDEDLDWLAASCPSVEYARRYRPLRRSVK